MPAPATTSPPPAWGTRLTGIEGLRAIACTMVLVGHVQWIGADEPYSLGRFTQFVWALAPTGLILFFVLSGFLLYRPFAASIILGYAFPEPRRFLTNRFWRLAPAYTVILILVGLVLGLAVTSADALFVDDQTVAITDANGGVGYLTDPWLLLANLFLVQNYFPDGVMTGLGPAWSLGVEVAFYLTLPVLALFAARIGRGRRLRGRALAGLVPAVVLLAVGLAGKAASAAIAPDDASPRDQWGQTWAAVLDRSFLTWADMFAFGMAAAVVVTLVRSGRLGWLQARHVARATIAACCAAIVVVGSVPMHPSAQALLLATVLTGVVLTIALPSRPTAARRALDLRPVAFVGVVSYSVYLWHMPIVGLLRRYDLTLDGRAGFVVMVAVVFGLSVAVAAVTYRYVELPGLRRKLRPTRDGGARGRGRTVTAPLIQQGAAPRTPQDAHSHPAP